MWNKNTINELKHEWLNNHNLIYQVRDYIRLIDKISILFIYIILKKIQLLQFIMVVLKIYLVKKYAAHIIIFLFGKYPNRKYLNYCLTIKQFASSNNNAPEESASDV